jgi:NitT/TauT family transport system ATP-binding protein
MLPAARQTAGSLKDELLTVWQDRGLTVMFITHSVEEAILLADRVVVLSPGAGRIVAEERVDLPRPRDVASLEFNAVRRRLAGMLHSHHGVASTP